MAETTMTTLNHIAPDLILVYALDEQEAAYCAALELTAQIDQHLGQGTRHYRTRRGVLLVSLDEVVRAVLDGELWQP